MQQPDGIANTGLSSRMCFAGGEPNYELPPSDGYQQELWHKPVPPVPPQGPSPHRDMSIQPLASAEVAVLGTGPATSPGGLSSEPSPQEVPPAGRHQPGFSAEMPVPRVWHPKWDVHWENTVTMHPCSFYQDHHLCHVGCLSCEALSKAARDLKDFQQMGQELPGLSPDHVFSSAP